MQGTTIVDATLENNASMSRKTQHSNAPMMLQKLRLAADLLCDEYQRMDAENVAGGGEAGAIVIDQVDKHVMDVLELLREMFRVGLKSKGGIFGGLSEPSLLRLLSEITLKSTFQEILTLGAEVDPIFDSESRHLEMAWFMMALNDVALPQYIDIIRQNPTLAKEYYDVDGSFILTDALSQPLVKIIHELESVYFDLEFQSYADNFRRSAMMGIISSSTASIASINQRLKVNGSLENLEALGLASSPVPESNKSSDLAEQFGDLQAAPSTGDTQSLQGSTTRSTSPRKSSPLKDSMILPEASDHEDEARDGEMGLPTLTINSASDDEEELEEIYSETETYQTRTTEPYFSSSDLTLTSLSGEEQEEGQLTEDEPTPATIASTSTISDLGFFGFPVPGVLRNQSSLLQNAIGFIGHHIPQMSMQPAQLGTSIPGDFETIDRVAEKEKLCLSCYDSEAELKICPIGGLGSQHFRCHDCQKVIGIGDYPSAKLCEISGLYFCSECHVDGKALSPALIINNWDFKKVPVSRTLYNLVGSESRSKLFDVEKLNPDLFVYVGELQDIKLLRTKLSSYAPTFMACTDESRLEIVRRIWPREHLIETINLYTIEDLCDARCGRLVDELKDWHKLVQKHVTNDCSDCQKRTHRLKI